MRTKRTSLPKGQKYEIEILGDSELSDEEDARVTKAMEIAEKEDAECRVNFRWQKEPLDLIKRAADEIGVPYQTYIKMCVFRQAKVDLGMSDHDEIAVLKKEIAELRKNLAPHKIPELMSVGEQTSGYEVKDVNRDIARGKKNKPKRR